MDDILFEFVGALFVYILVAIFGWVIPFSEDLAVKPPEESESPTATLLLLAILAAGALVVRNTLELAVLIACVVWFVASVIGTVKREVRSRFTFWDIAVPVVAIAYFGTCATVSVNVGMLRTFATPAMLLGVVLFTVVTTIITSSGRLNPWNFVFSAGSTACAALFALACFEVAQYMGWIGDVWQATVPLRVSALASSLLFVVLTYSRAILLSDEGGHPNTDLAEDVRSFLATVTVWVMIALGGFVTYTHFAWNAPTPMS